VFDFLTNMGRGGEGFFRTLGSAWNKTMSGFNHLLKYDTPRITRVLDRRLGWLNMFFQALIMGYLAVAIYLDGAYLRDEDSVGAVVAKMSGETYSTDQHKQVRFWEYADAQYPPVESGAIFLATRVMRTNLQVVEICANPMHKCGANAGAKGSGKAPKPKKGNRRLLTTQQQKAGPGDQNHGKGPEGPKMKRKSQQQGRARFVAERRARRQARERPEGEGMARKAERGEGTPQDLKVSGRVLLANPAPPANSKKDPMKGAKVDPACSKPKAPYGTGKCAMDESGCLEHIWCPPEGASSLRTLDIELQDLSDFTVDFTASIGFPGLSSKALLLKHHVKPMPIKELLQKVGASEDQVKKTGAIISVRFYWECNAETQSLLEGCEPKISFSRLDKDQPGFSWRRATYYYTNDGERARDVQRMAGLRITMSAYGHCVKSDILKLILELSIGLVLLGLSKSFTDFFMLNTFADARRYRHYKIEESEDFGDLSERLQNLDAEEQRRLLEQKRRRETQMKKTKKRR